MGLIFLIIVIIVVIKLIKLLQRGDSQPSNYSETIVRDIGMACVMHKMDAPKLRMITVK